MLKPEARERLARIALVKPDKARGVEEFIMQQAARGQITEKISEDRLIRYVHAVWLPQACRLHCCEHRLVAPLIIADAGAVWS